MDASPTLTADELTDLVGSLAWYHTLELGNGIVTLGEYDHRPYLPYYGLPADLSGKTVLDVGPASGFFSFEFERRGAQVTAAELPNWLDHDFGPNYKLEHPPEESQVYLHRPFAVARQLRNSQVAMKYVNIYDLAPETVGLFDLVFSGSMLIHLTDPIKALWRIASVTKEKAILVTVIDIAEPDRPIAHMIGAERGDAWWIPTRACLELMAVAAGFVGIEWVGEFQLNYRNQTPGHYHGVLHAYKTTAGWTPQTRHRDEVLQQRSQNVPSTSGYHTLAGQRRAQQQEIDRLSSLVHGYENGRFMRLMRWLDRLR